MSCYRCVQRAVTLLCLFLSYLHAAPFQAGGTPHDRTDTLAAHCLKDCSDLREKGQYSAALEAGLKAVGAFQQSGDISGAANTQKEIAQIYQYLGEQKNDPAYIEQGLAYARNAIAMYHSVQDTAGEIISLNGQGILLRSMALLDRPAYYDSALTCYQQALAMIPPSGKGRQFTGTLYNNISQVYLEHKHDYPTALQYLQAAVRFNKQQKNFGKLSYNYGNIAQVYQLMGDRRSSLDYAYKTLDIARQVATANRILNAYQQLYDSYHAFGMPDSALHYYLLYDGVRDSIASVTTARQIAEIQTKYETEKSKALIGHLNVQNDAQRKEILALVAGVVLLLLFLLGLFLLFGRVRRQHKLISRQSRQLEIMMKELHHRVKNNLQVVTSLLSLQSYRLKDEEALDAIRLSQQRVQAMSFIHQRLYAGEDTRMVNMEEYLRDLATSLITAYGYAAIDFDLQISVAGNWVDVDKALPMGLIANEIITNALKYAYTGSHRPALYIALSENKGHLTFSFKDNGGGWDEKQWQKAGSSFGKQLVASLCRQLNASEELTIAEGAAFVFTIPLEKAA
jgi:two-component sensor histidine kinase